MSRQLVCWRCGASLKDIPHPIGRLAQCPACRAELHCCRLCRFYGPELRYGCHHDRADPVLDKNKANFCSHFRPRPDAYSPPDDSRQQAALTELDALFGASPGTTANADASGTSPTNRPDPRDELEKLFRPNDN